MAKVILLDSPSWKLFNPTMHLHLGILYLAGSLRAAGHDVEVWDCHEVTSWDAKAGTLVVHKDLLDDCDVLGLSATTANLNWGAQLAREWPARYKVLGGPHATHIINGPHVRFKQRKYFEPFDYVMIEECEESFTTFCNWIETGIEPRRCPIPGLVYWNEFGMQHFPAGAAPDVTKIPPPAFDLWRHGFNKGGLAGTTGDAQAASHRLTASLYTARGCPYGCTFCADARTKVRDESYERIEEEVAMLAKLGVSAIRIQDDTYTIRKDRARRIAEILHNYGMVWRGTTRVNLVDRELFKHFKDHGCTELGFGIEHADDRMLKAMEKGTTAAKNEESVIACQGEGIIARCFMMVGFPGETWESVESIASWVRRVRPGGVTLSLFTPFPGCEVWNHPEKFGVEIPHAPFEKFWQLGGDDDPETLVLTLPTISKAELFRARQYLIKVIDSEIGHRDRTRMDGNVGTFLGPSVQDGGYSSGG